IRAHILTRPLPNPLPPLLSLPLPPPHNKLILGNSSVVTPLRCLTRSLLCGSTSLLSQECSLEEMLGKNDEDFATDYMGIGRMLVPPPSTWL
ncbi:hypothetical protein GIB67_029557, partial [Kingdonia uniflora]